MEKEPAHVLDDILNDETPCTARALADSYLNREKNCPIPSLKKFEEVLKKMHKDWKLVEKGVPEELESEMLNIPLNMRKEMISRLPEKTRKKLEDNYDAKIVEQAINALVDFEPFIKENALRVVNEGSKKHYENARKDCMNRIKAADFLLTDERLSDTEKESLQVIKFRHEALLKNFDSFRRVTVDPVKEALINRAGTPSLLGFKREEWLRDFYLACHTRTVFVKPPTKPIKVFRNALVLVIYTSLENLKTRRSHLNHVGRRKELSANIINESLHLSITAKNVDNIIHTS